MVNCCVVGCPKRSDLDREISFHNIPNRPYEKERRKKWFSVINRKNPDGTLWQPNPTSARICSEHFVGGKVSNVENHPGYVPSILPGKYKKKQINGSSALLRYERSRRRSSRKSIVSVQEDVQLVEPLQTTEDILTLATSVSTQVNFDYNVTTTQFEFIATREVDGFSTYCCISGTMMLPTKIKKKDASCGTEDVLQVYNDHQAVTIKDEMMIEEEAIMLNVDMIIDDHDQHDDLCTTPSSLVSTHQTEVIAEADILHDGRPSENCYIVDFVMKDEFVMNEEPMCPDEDMTHNDPQADLTSTSSLAPQQADPSPIRCESDSSVPGEKPYACGICDYRAFQLSALKKHMRTHTGEKPYSCDICDYRTGHLTGLKRHVMTHTGEKPHTCNVCDYRTAHLHHLNTHLRTHTGEKPHACGICGYRTGHLNVLKAHMRTHSGEKPHTCNICDYRTGQISNLKTHMRTHTGEKPHACGTCDYRAGQVCDLKIHMRIHTGEKPHACDFCDYRTRELCNLKTHIRTHTGEKPHTCNICDYKTGQQSALKRHMRAHTSEKPHACDVCDFRARELSDLKRHMRTHTGERPHACHICDYRAGLPSHLKRHMRTHSGTTQ